MMLPRADWEYMIAILGKQTVAIFLAVYSLFSNAIASFTISHQRHRQATSDSYHELQFRLLESEIQSEQFRSSLLEFLALDTSPETPLLVKFYILFIKLSVIYIIGLALTYVIRFAFELLFVFKKWTMSLIRLSINILIASTIFWFVIGLVDLPQNHQETSGFFKMLRVEYEWHLQHLNYYY